MAYTPQLVRIASYSRPLKQTWNGSFNFPISGGGHAEKNSPTNITFSKTGSYAWSFWIKFDVDEDVYRQIILLGSLNSNGYRIVKDRVGGLNTIGIQEVSSSFSVDRWYYPTGFDITQWHHILITWVGNSSSSVSTYCYINGIWTTTKANSITWANAVASTGKLTFGYDFSDHTIGGNINDIAFYNRIVYPNEVFDIMQRRSFTNPVGLWRCEDGATIVDSTSNTNNLTYYNGADFQDVDQSYDLTI